TVSLRWKGTVPVTLHDGTIAAPDGAAALTSTDAVATGHSSSSQGGFTTTTFGDYTLTLDVPDGTTSWTATVKLAGRLPAGTTRAFRAAAPYEPPALVFPQLDVVPAIVVVGEVGGPNDVLLTAEGASPTLRAIGGGRRCGAYPLEPGDAP